MKIRFKELLSRRQGQVDPECKQKERLRILLDWRKGRAGVLHCIILYFGRDRKMKSFIISSIKKEIKFYGLGIGGGRFTQSYNKNIGGQGR